MGREQECDALRLQGSLFPKRGRLSNPSLERFRSTSKYQDRAAGDIVFCVAACANGMIENRIERSLEDDCLFRDPTSPRRTADYGEMDGVISIGASSPSS